MRIYTFRRAKHVFESSDSQTGEGWKGVWEGTEKKILTEKILRETYQWDTTTTFSTGFKFLTSFYHDSIRIVISYTITQLTSNGIVSAFCVLYKII